MVQMIRTAEDMARAIETAPDTQLKALLSALAERLAEYPDYAFEDLAEIVIVQPGDTLQAIEEACKLRWVVDGKFVSPVELIAEHEGWFEVTWILSDDGFGLVLFLEKAEGIDPQLLAACRHALAEHQPHEQDGSER
jgi:hypothetical protein